LTRKVLDLIKTRRNSGIASLAVLIDPDFSDKNHLSELIHLCNKARVDFLFVGGSLVRLDRLDFVLDYISEHSDIPVILFPGDIHQISPKADAFLLLSLISGRNPEYLIGKQVLAAPMLKRSGLEIISTAYMVVDGGAPTTVSYMSNTFPLPNDKPGIAASTALAGELLGFQVSYLDTGSGAQRMVHPDIIKAVRKETNNPIIVGGGIRSSEMALQLVKAGADVIVIGNAFEQNPELIQDIADSIHSLVSEKI
jgi:phosphoglycerol geranylgeranyltransferase